MTSWIRVIEALLRSRLSGLLALAVLFAGLMAGYLVWRISTRMLRRLGVPAIVEGTVFERTAYRLGTSTVGILSGLAALFVYLGALIIALSVSRVLNAGLLWSQLTTYMPRLFIAALAIIVSLVIGDKAKLRTSERLRSIKLPEVDVIPELVKYSIFYVGALVALGQLGVVTEALLVLLAAYAFGVIFLGGLALKDLLASAAAGFYLLFTEPYTIGDEVRVGDHRGIVQEVDMFVTRIESDGEEFVVPNHLVMQNSIVRIRE